MKHNNKRAKALYPENRQTYDAIKKWLPAGSLNLLKEALKEVYGDLAPSESTIEKVVLGTRPDNYGIMAMAKAMADKNQRVLEAKVEQLAD